ALAPRVALIHGSGNGRGTTESHGKNAGSPGSKRDSAGLRRLFRVIPSVPWSRLRVAAALDRALDAALVVEQADGRRGVGSHRHRGAEGAGVVVDIQARA